MSQKSILLVDDDIDDAYYLKEILSQIDISLKIEIVITVRQLFRYLERCDDQSLPSLMVIDFGMPVMNGAEILEKLKADPRYNDIPKIVWSSVALSGQMARCLEAGAIDYFPKIEKASQMKGIARRMLELATKDKMYDGRAGL